MSGLSTSASVVDSDPNSIKNIFENLSYGPAPEADNVAQVKKVVLNRCCSLSILAGAGIGPMLLVLVLVVDELMELKAFRCPY